MDMNHGKDSQFAGLLTLQTLHALQSRGCGTREYCFYVTDKLRSEPKGQLHITRCWKHIFVLLISVETADKLP